MKSEEFLNQRHNKILGDGFSREFDPEMWSVRVNTLKIDVKSFKERFESIGYVLEPIPWCTEGFWIRTSDPITKFDEYYMGQFFSQNASSMIPPVALNLSGIDIVLDMAASPGSKTTQMSALMENKGAIVANDVDKRRLKILKSNLQRCGCVNVATTMNRGEDIWKCGLEFDKILLDAPCTGTGSLNPRINKSTGESVIRGSAKRQKALLTSASKCLKKGGTLIYSTCSLEPEENESVANFAVRVLGMKVEKLKVNVSKDFRCEPLEFWDGEYFDREVKKAIRILPTNRTEGFFICALSL